MLLRRKGEQNCGTQFEPRSENELSSNATRALNLCGCDVICGGRPQCKTSDERSSGLTVGRKQTRPGDRKHLDNRSVPVATLRAIVHPNSRINPTIHNEPIPHGPVTVLPPKFRRTECKKDARCNTGRTQHPKCCQPVTMCILKYWRTVREAVVKHCEVYNRVSIQQKYPNAYGGSKRALALSQSLKSFFPRGFQTLTQLSRFVSPSLQGSTMSNER